MTMAMGKDDAKAGSFALRVAACRAALGLSQSAFARKLDVSFATVNRWERGHTLPGPESVGRLELLEHLVASPAAPGIHGALPRPATRFFGRERELEAVGAALRENRLVTIAGPGGSGKTRLAIELVSRSRDAGGAHPVFVGLDTIAPDGDVASLAAAAFGMADAAEPLDAVVEHLGSAPVVLVLDNCEHVLQAASLFVSQLLGRCPGVKVLATSRQPLPLALGQTFWLTPFPDGDHEASLLFLDRAKRAGWSPVETDAPVIAGLCSRLDGLPLAIELAASLAPAISPQDLLARLNERLDLLRSEDTDRPGRHRGLRATLSWSHELLTAPERLLFQRLSVFPGPFTLTAAEGACGSFGDDASDDLRAAQVALTLARLVQKSLVQVRLSGQARTYLLLDTVRLFAREKAAEHPDDEQRVRRRLVEWATALAAAAEEHMEGKQQERWLRLLDDESDAWRAALMVAIEDGDARGAVALAGSLHRYWHTRSHIREGLGWTRRALALPGRVTPSDRARALLGAGVMARQRGDLPVAASFIEEYLSIQLEAGDTAGIARAYNSLAGVLHSAGRTGEAEHMLRQGIEYWRRAGDRRGLASALSNLGIIACDAGDYDAAERLGVEALELRRELGHPGSIAISLENLATVALRSGRLEEARERFSDALNRYVALDEPDGVATCLEGFAALAAQRGDPETAVHLYGAAGALREEIDVAASPGDVAFHEPLRHQLREPGPAWFDAGIERGRNLSREEYLALAARSGTIQPPQLTSRERDVLHLLVSGDSNKEIARRLRLSERTVNGHLTSIYRKLGARGRTDAVALAFRTLIT